MSNVSTAHSVHPFVAGKSEALTGQRLAKVGYKSTAKNPAKFPSVCASIPFIGDNAIIDNVPALVSHIRAMLESAQDGIIRSLYESSDGSLTSIGDDDISIAACINFLEADAQGSRLTKEYIGAWFDSNVRDNLTVIFAEKLGFIKANDDNPSLTEMQEFTIDKHLNGYRDLFSSLAGGKTILQPKQVDGLNKALILCAVEDDTSRKLKARLEAMQNKPKLEELLEL